MARARVPGGAGALVPVVCIAACLAAAVLIQAAGASQPKRQSTAAGNALAQTVALKLSDFTGPWKTAPVGSATVVTCKSFDPKQSDLTTVGEVNQGFTSADGASNAFYRVAVFKTARQAQASWNRLVRPALLKCLGSKLVNSIASPGITVKLASTGSLPLSIPGRRHAGYRIAADVSASGESLKAYLDVILQGNARADTTLLVLSVGQPPAAALETKLAGAIAGRLPAR